MSNIKQNIKNAVSRSYLNRDRDAFKAMLLQHARTFFADKINDFSESSLGGLLLDMPAEIGDNMSFYLDHQFAELDPELAVESQNIKRHLSSAGVKITGASPAVVALSWAIEVPAELAGATYRPLLSALPVILQGSIVEANGVQFELTEDLDYSELKPDGTFKADVIVGDVSSNGSPSSYVLVHGGAGKAPGAPEGFCVSGFRESESFVIPNSYVQFRELTLAQENVTEVISVTDSDGNQYWEVESLAHDTVFKGKTNSADDSSYVDESLSIIPAPYRYVKIVDYDTKLTTLRFGNGNAATLLDDIIPDPSELALPLYGKQTFTRYTLDPNKLLSTQTLGIAPINTTINVIYRYGGGLKHNVAANTINTVTTLKMSFSSTIDTALAQQVRNSTSVINKTRAIGGENAPTLDELKGKIQSARNSQGRIVTASDLLARIYTMPSNFGRVFRAGIRSNPQNPLATQLFIVSRDANGNLIISPDTLKKNLALFLNEFRMISDSIDILDAAIINISVEFKITVEQNNVKNIVLQNIITSLKKFFDIKNFHIDQPVKIDDVRNIIFNTPGVATIIDIKFRNMSSNETGRSYSDIKFDVTQNIRKQLLLPPPGAIFEVRYPDFDIIGNAL